MSLFKRFLGLGMVLSAVACAAPSDDGMEAVAGWRAAHVDRVLSAGEHPAVVGSAQDCRLAMPESTPDQTWLLVHYRRPPMMVFRVVPAVDHRGHELGEKIWINVSDCHAQPQVRVMSAKVNGI